MKIHRVGLKVSGVYNSVLSDINLWNDLGFNLCVTPFIYYMVVTSDEWIKSKMRVSANLVCHCLNTGDQV